MFEARARMSPETAHAVGRLVGYMIRELGWGWGLTAAGGAALAGWAAWTAPTWRPSVREWLDQ